MGRSQYVIEGELDVANRAVSNGAPGSVEKAAALAAELADASAAPAAPTDDGFEAMKVAELRELAAERGVDLTGRTRKAAIIRTLRGES